MHAMPRPDGMDDWTDEQMTEFSDNLTHHPCAIARLVGRPLNEVLWLWHEVLGNLTGDDDSLYPAFVVLEWRQFDAAVGRRNEAREG